MVYSGYYKVMSNIPKMGQLPTPGFVLSHPIFKVNLGQGAVCCGIGSAARKAWPMRLRVAPGQYVGRMRVVFQSTLW